MKSIGSLVLEMGCLFSKDFKKDINKKRYGDCHSVFFMLFDVTSSVNLRLPPSPQGEGFENAHKHTKQKEDAKSILFR